ncbi:MAG: MarR family transcriptional regulator [Propionibacteriales bacterium]|nr:MarR family transcriptional regulator [Propionibacteriales bacterium]
MTTTEAPPPASDEAILVALMQLGRQMRRLHHGDDLEIGALPVLHVLGRTTTLRLSDLAAKLELDASTISRHIRQLEDRGFVQRTDDPDDRRATRLALTDEGRKKCQKAMECRRTRVNEALEDWSKSDRADLQRLLIRFADDLATRTT